MKNAHIHPQANVSSSVHTRTVAGWQCTVKTGPVALPHSGCFSGVTQAKTSSLKVFSTREP
jgi:hypothetical protein